MQAGEEGWEPEGSWGAMNCGGARNRQGGGWAASWREGVAWQPAGCGGGGGGGGSHEPWGCWGECLDAGLQGGAAWQPAWRGGGGRSWRDWAAGGGGTNHGGRSGFWEGREPVGDLRGVGRELRGEGQDAAWWGGGVACQEGLELRSMEAGRPTSRRWWGQPAGGAGGPEVPAHRQAGLPVGAGGPAGRAGGRGRESRLQSLQGHLPRRRTRQQSTTAGAGAGGTAAV